nr:hypothetical protein [uncultured Macellibacteroides sp.]
MKNYYIYIILFCIFLSCQSKNVEKSSVLEMNSQVVGTYLWKYPIEIASTLNEDNRIVISNGNNGIEGLYYGTTDEFVDAREGYLPGYFVLRTYDLYINGDTIKFTLKPEKTDFFTKPIDISIKSSKDAAKKGYIHWDIWDNYSFQTSKNYQGLIKDSKTIIFSEDSNNKMYTKKFIKEN